MARLIFPSGFAQQKDLSAAITAKHLADDTKSVLTAFFTEQGIDPTTFATKAAEAQTHESARALLFGQSKQATELRDLKLQQPIVNLKNAVQFLKKLYGDKPQKLSDWGVTITGDSKVSYPVAIDELAKLAIAFATKHLSYNAGSSPLEPFAVANEIDFANDKLALQAAQAADAEAKIKAEQSAKETQLRDAAWATTEKQLNAIGQYLMNLYFKTPRKAISWGFAIDDSNTTAKEIKTNIKLGDKSTLKGVLIGSTLKNTGNVDLHVYKGKSNIGDPIVVKPGESLGIQKGFSTITISNPDNTQGANFITTRSR